MPSWSTIYKSIKYSWTNHTGIQIATYSVLVATFTVIFSIFSLSINLKRVLVHWGESVQITAYVKDGTSSESISKIESALQDMGGFKDLNYISKEQAQKIFEAQMGRYYPDLMNDPEFVNPFPANFQLTLGSSADFNNIEQVAGQIMKINDIEDVSYGQDWVKNYASLVSTFSRSGWLVVIVLLIGSAFVIGNSIRTSIAHRHDEIQILELVGATSRMIWVPFVVDGALMGMLATLSALGIGYLIYIWGMSTFGSNLAFSALTSQFHYMTWSWFFATLMVGLLVGAVSSFLCVRSVSRLSVVRSFE